MKTILTKILIPGLMCIFFGHASAGIFTSVPAGGNWSVASTWDKNTVPGANDTVVVAGPGVVILNGNFSCSELYITPEGILEPSNSNPTLSVAKNLVCSGTIRLSYWNTNIHLSLGGNLEVSGSVIMGNLTMNGSTEQTLATASGIVLNIKNLTQSDITQPLTALSSLALNGTTINLGGGTLQFAASNSRLSLTGCTLNNGTLNMNGGEFECLDGSRVLTSTNFVNTQLLGTVSVAGSINFSGPMTVVGVLESLYNNTATITVADNITNMGTIRRTNLNLYFLVLGNIQNAGNWNSSSIEFMGNGSQQVSCNPEAFFDLVSFTALTTASPIVATTSLEIRNAAINFNSGSLIMQQGSESRLTLENCITQQITIQGNGAELWLKKWGYLFTNTTLDAMVLRGRVETHGNVFFRGNMVVQDTLQNRWNYSSTLDVQDILINNGAILNQNQTFLIRARGNVHNNGEWSNNSLEFSGEGNQQISQLEGRFFQVLNVTALSFKNSTLNFGNVTLIMQVPGSRFSATDNSFVSNIYIKGNQGEFYMTNLSYLTLSTLENMTIKGKVRVTGNNTFKGTMVIADTLSNRWNYSAGLVVEDSLANHGVIEAENLNLAILIKGHIRNHGIWRNQWLEMLSDGTQQISQGPDCFFQVPTVVLLNTSENLTATSDLTFDGSNINFNNKTLILQAGALKKLSFTNSCVVSNIRVAGNGGELFMNNNSRVQTSTLENLNLTGFGIFNADNFLQGRMVVIDSIINRYNYNATLFVEDSLVNLGKILNNNANLTINVKKNIRNNGIWKNNHLNLNGTTAQEIFCENNHWFEVANFTHLSPANAIVVKQALGFSESNVDLNGAQVIMPQGGLLFMSGTSGYKYLREFFVTGGDFELQMAGEGAYLFDAQFYPNVILSGTARLRDIIVFHKYLIVNGHLANLYNYNATLNVGKRLTNNGTIENLSGSLYINCQGNIINNGIWQNTRTVLNGTSDQYIFLIKHKPITGQIRFEVDAGNSPYQWHYNGSVLSPGSFSGLTTNVLIWNVPVQEDWYGVFHSQTGAGPSRKFTVGGGLLADFKVLLQGPFNGSGMHTMLNQGGYLPLTQPYNTAPWSYSGTEAVTAIPNENVVDWVLVELRETDGGPETATAATATARFAAFLLNDGRIVQTDGESEIGFNLSITQNLFAVIRHRNSLAIMTAIPLVENEGVYFHNFTTGASQAYGGSSGLKELAPGLWGMYGGDGDANGQIQTQDKNNIWNPQSGLSGYHMGDFDLNGQVQTQDKNNIWNPNSGVGTSVP